MTSQDAVAELQANAGTQFDPAVVSALMRVVERGEPIVSTASDVRAVLANSPLRQEPSTTSAA